MGKRITDRLITMTTEETDLIDLIKLIILRATNNMKTYRHWSRGFMSDRHHKLEEQFEIVSDKLIKIDEKYLLKYGSLSRLLDI